MKHLTAFLALLEAARKSHHTAHWITKGPNFYGDHLLFERLYTAIDGEIDAIGERLTQRGGEEAVDPVHTTELTMNYLEHWAKTQDIYERAQIVERTIQAGIVSVRKEMTPMSPGLDNLLVSIADAHETPLYLLGQRVKGN